MALPSPLALTARVALSLALGGLAPPPAGAAFDFSGTKTITGVTVAGDTVALGTVQFSPLEKPEIAFKIKLNTEALTDYFLSMREFKCLPSAKELSCHVPYPYAHPGKISPGQLAWLEHQLLFFYKAPAEFGAKLWNGIYFEFSEQGQTLVGRPKAVDLNDISAPPANLAQPPFKKASRHELPPGSRWLDRLVIE
jgi:hypothetical protein